MQTKVLIIAVIENEHGEILMRKKPDGSPPYKETWYSFHGELTPGRDIEETVNEAVKKQTGVSIKLRETIGWDTEVKHDLDGIEKQFVYLDALFDYIEGELSWGEGIEKLQWIPKTELKNYDLVPPGVILFKKLGYIS